jgi:eukaryotic-like serine/threonine-protein kinase
LVGEVIAGRYELQELVGTGGMSSVYRADDRELERPVALKLLHERLGADDEHVTRFRHEAESVARLSHPNIVPVMDRGVDGGRQYIVFEFVDGESLRQLLDREGPLGVRHALEIAIAVADGLAFAHAHGIVHRDVKPQNVLISREGEIKVTDFGIARSADSGLTQTGTVLGTSNYLSPEQAGGQQVTAAADVYSLGVVLYEMLAGDVPFPGGNQVVVALRHATEAPPPLPNGVPPRLAAAVTRALAKDPARRFASMAEFATELRACLTEPLPRPEPPTRVSHRTRRSSLPLVAALLALVAAATVVVVLVLSGRQESRHNASGPGGAATVTLRGVTGYDPAGTNGEHNAKAPLASDGRLATFWETETYATPDFGNLKSGVGLVLDAGTAVKLGSLTVKTNTPGYTARILAGNSPSGPFDDDSADRTVGVSTTFALNGATARYYVVWITLLPPGDVAHVNEATAG